MELEGGSMDGGKDGIDEGKEGKDEDVCVEDKKCDIASGWNDGADQHLAMGRKTRQIFNQKV